MANKDGQATFTKLKAGKDYTVSANNDEATVRPVTKVGKASDLTVMTTDQVGTVDLTWNHKATKARGGDTIGYTITATPADGSEPITMEAATTEAELSGLDPAALYSFSVTPHNALGDGKPSVARMSRSLADITGITGPPQPDASSQAPAQPAPAPAAPSSNQHPLQHPSPARHRRPSRAPRRSTSARMATAM